MIQYQLAAFLDSYDTILFDMDGVVTSEQAYWDAAALTVYEIYHSSQYFGSKTLDARDMSANLRKIRSEIFCNDRTIRLVKNKGVNSNWDLAYTVLGMALISGKSANFNTVYHEIDDTDNDAFALYSAVAQRLSVTFGKEQTYFERLGTFWQEVTSCFQEWYLGDELFQKIYERPVHLPGKPGLMSTEAPLVDKSQLLTLLSLMHRSGKRLGIGTGRLRAEAVPVLKEWDALGYFADDAIITYNDVTNAEKELCAKGIDINLTKPHPFMFLKGCFGNSISAMDTIDGNYDTAVCQRTLVVGDAGADLFAARAAGCDFAAVLTGVQGEGARGFFETENADFILNNVLEFMTEKE